MARFWEIGINETFINQVQLGFIRCKIIILIQSDVTFKILDFQIPKCSKSQIQYSSVNQASTDGLSVVRIRPWSGRSIVKNPSTRSPQQDKLPASESVHDIDGRILNFGPLFTWTGGPSADGYLCPWRPYLNYNCFGTQHFQTGNFSHVIGIDILF